MMWKVWIIKFLYYLFFMFVFTMAIIIFLEIMNVGFYKEYIGDYIYKIIENLNF